MNINEEEIRNINKIKNKIKTLPHVIPSVLKDAIITEIHTDYMYPDNMHTYIVLEDNNYKYYIHKYKKDNKEFFLSIVREGALNKNV